MSRDIKYLVVHCTATGQNTRIDSIRKYWKETLGWKSPGYHFIIDAVGYRHEIHPIDKPSNGVAGYNANSIHISYIGGVDKQGKPIDNRTAQQKFEIRSLLHELKTQFPKAIIQGHRDFLGVKKACPSFDAKTEYAGMGT